MARALILLRARRIRALLEKISRLSFRPGHRLNADELPKLLSKATRRLIIVDASHGGGASIASVNAENSYLADGWMVCRLGIDSLGTLTLRIQSAVERDAVIERHVVALPSLDLSLFQAIRVDSLEGFVDPFTMANWLAKGAQSGCELFIQWHDHYMICPSHFLLDSQSNYCDVPPDPVCARCLPANNHCQKASLRSVQVTQWRTHWSSVLMSATSVSVFSPSSLNLVRRVWPELPEEKIVVEPHQLPPMATLPDSYSGASNAPIHVAVVGRIGIHKGAAKVLALAQQYRQLPLDNKITVIGTIDINTPNHIVTETGPYDPADLPLLWADRRLDVAWFPSIWPETFSYVLHELMQLGVPILAFDMGAQGDYLKNYRWGRLLKSGSTAAATAVALQELAEDYRMAQEQGSDNQR